MPTDLFALSFRLERVYHRVATIPAIRALAILAACCMLRPDLCLAVETIRQEKQGIKCSYGFHEGKTKRRTIRLLGDKIEEHGDARLTGFTGHVPW